jgi:nitric oxide reductase NorD protein
MPEAEDVILEAAERATAAARDLWRRRRSASARARGVALDDVERPLALLLTACLGGRWPLCPSDAPPAAGWLARRLGKPPPWEIAPPARGFTDGTQIFLPRRLELAASEIGDREVLRLLALSLGARVAGGSLTLCPAEPVARDLFWAADGARIDAWLAAELPGLSDAIEHARRLALARRPVPRSLTVSERAVEAAACRLLCQGFHAETPDACAAWAADQARDPVFGEAAYRGMAPVLHWGIPRPDLSAAAPSASSAVAPAARPFSARRLRRRIEARDVADEEKEGRPGPFFVPFGDPPQTVQDPAGLRRPLDQEKELDLDTLAEEIERLSEVPRIRSHHAVHEVLERDSARAHSWPASPRGTDPVGLRYPEWDHLTSSYRPAHCLLRERQAPSGDPTWSGRVLDEHRELLADLRRRFERLRPRRERHPREREGDELDVDAVVEDFADRRAGRAPSERLYLAERPLRRDVTVALLIDASGSTDAWVSGGRTVLEVEKQATLVLCEALRSLGDRHGVYAFCGRGAQGVRVSRVKAFDERTDEEVRARIAGLAGADYTRLGAPIRHLTATLARERSRIRLLFLLSDGKPNDADEYEGRYGIEDTRQAVVEARLQGLAVFCLTIDREGSTYLPHMFGPHGYTVAARVAELPRRLPEIYRAVTS